MAVRARCAWLPISSATIFACSRKKLVVQKEMNPNTEVSWKSAREQDPGINLGEVIEREVTPAGFGRVAALTAKQVLMQKLRDAERDQVASEYSDKQGELFRGVVQRLERGDVVMQLGKAEAILPFKEQAHGETYRFGESYYVFVIDVRQGYRGPSIMVSRSHPGLLRNLFTREVPEIAEGIVELKAVAREAGQRSKIAVAAENPDVDPVGACVGPRGNRVAKVVGELGNEKVDIVRWSDDPIELITNALSPAQVIKVSPRRRGADGDGDGDRLGRSAIAGDWQAGPERAPGGQADQLAHRYSHGETVRRRAGQEDVRCARQRGSRQSADARIEINARYAVCHRRRRRIGGFGAGRGASGDSSHAARASCGAGTGNARDARDGNVGGRRNVDGRVDGQHGW